MAFRSKGTDAAAQRVAEAQADAADLREQVTVLREENSRLKARKPKNKDTQTVDVIGGLLALEAPAREAAANYPSGPNSDAVKHALTAAAHGLAHVRKALDQVRRLGRPA